MALSEAHAVSTAPIKTARHRIAAAFVLAVLAVGCVAFWVCVPLGTLWALSKATDSFAGHFVLGLLLAPMAMALFSPILFWLNGLYLRISGALDPLADDKEESGWQRRVRGPLEPMLLASFVVALLALFFWFFFLAENPPRQVL